MNVNIDTPGDVDRLHNIYKLNSKKYKFIMIPLRNKRIYPSGKISSYTNNIKIFKIFLNYFIEFFWIKMMHSDSKLNVAQIVIFIFFV